jgi:hypothetical protein
MPEWFDNLFPQSQVSLDNRVFAEEIERVKWLRTPKALLGYNLMLAYGIGTVAVGWYVVRDSNHSYAGTQLLLGVLGVLAIVFAVLSDINCTRLAIRSLKDQPADADKYDLISANLALTQIRAWWLMGLESAFRVAFFLILFIAFLNLSFWNIGQELSSQSELFVHIVTLSSQLATAPGAWGVLLAMAILLVIQMLEPTWRLRTVAALGLRQAERNPEVSLVTALPNLVLVWGITLFVYIVPGVFLAFMLRNAALNSVAFGLIAYSLVVGVTLWGVFDWVDSSALHPKEKRIVPLEDTAATLPEENES